MSKLHLFILSALVVPSSVFAESSQPWSVANQNLFECATTNNLGNVRWISALRQGKSGLSGDALNAAIFNAGNIVVHGCPKDEADGQKVTVRIMQISDRYREGVNAVRPQDSISDCVISREPAEARLFVTSYDAAMFILAEAVVSGKNTEGVAPIVEKELDMAISPLKLAMKICAEEQQFDAQLDVIGFYSRANWSLRAEPILTAATSSHQGVL